MTKFKIPLLAEGEIYLGGFVDANGDVTHTILLPGDNDAATWQAQMDWAKGIDGDLLTCSELVIAYEQHRGQFQKAAYWSNTRDGEPDFYYWAWYRGFYGGDQRVAHQDHRLRARAVRRVKGS
jgi:hypothetical protein